MSLSFKERLKIYFHIFFSYLFLPLALLLNAIFISFIMRYRIRNLADARKKFADLTKQQYQNPILICLNHLTYIDSYILVNTLIPYYKMLFSYSKLPWHMIEYGYVSHIYMFFKAIVVKRMGTREDIKRSLEEVKFLLNKGNMVIVFPEGTRSESGRVNVNEFQYGIGNIIRDLQNVEVLTIYFRADKQLKKSKLPPYKSVFDVQFKLIKPTTSYSGLRASKDLAGQIVYTLHEMENQYFLDRTHDRK